MAGALVGGAVSLIGQKKANKATDKAMNAQIAAQNAALEEQRRQYDTSRSDQMPWLQTGTWALDQQKKALMGDWSGFNQSPDYQYALDQGFKGLDRSAAARGRLYSGGYGEDLTKFGQGLATQNYGNYMNRLAGLSGSGQTASNALGILGQNYANAYSTGQGNIGNARAGAYGDKAYNSLSAFNGIGNAFSDWYGGQNKSMNNGFYLGNNPGKG